MLGKGSDQASMLFCWCPTRLGALAEGFWLAKHPVSQAQWAAVMGGKNPSHFKGPERPVDSVSWEDAQAFCRASGLRLPSEAEWAYACRAGTRTDFAVGVGEALNAQLANFDGNGPGGSGDGAFKWLYREETLPAGSFPPNAWGLHDMHGQLWEWCEDLYNKGGGGRVLRGGGWFLLGVFARSASRFGRSPGLRVRAVGFRPAPSSSPGQLGPQSGARSGARDERNEGPAQRRKIFGF